jgi:hypothetical protein
MPAGPPPMTATSRNSGFIIMSKLQKSLTVKIRL